MAIQIPGPTQQLQTGGKGAPQISNPDSRNLLGLAQGADAVGKAAGQIAQNERAVSEAQKAADEKLAEVQRKAAEELRMKTNITTATEAQNLTQSVIRDYTAKVQQERRGLGAKGLTEDATTYLDDNIQQIGDAIEDPEARAMYVKAATQMKNSTLDSMSSFQAGQLNSALSSSLESSIASNVDFGAANTGNPQGIAIARANIVNASANMVNGGFWSPEEGKYQEQKALATMHTQIFDNLAAIDPDAARKYKDDNIKEMGGDLKHFADVLKVKDDLIPAQKLADKLIREKTPFAEKYQAIRDNLQGQQRENAMRIMKEYEQGFNDEEKATNAANVNQAEQLFAETRNVSDLQNKFPALWASLPGDVRLSMQDRQRTPQEQVVGDDVTYLWLKQQAGLNPKFMIDPSFNLGLYASKLNIQQLTDINKDLIAVRSGKGLGVGTLVQDVNAAVKSLEVPGRFYGATGLTSEEKADFFQSVSQKIEEVENETHLPVTSEQRKKIIDDLTADTVWTSGWTSLDKHTTLGSVLGHIPTGEKAQIKASLQSQGLPTTDEAIAKMYIKAHPR
jgi:hypothetical protein